VSRIEIEIFNSDIRKRRWGGVVYSPGSLIEKMEVHSREGPAGDGLCGSLWSKGDE
jgi:hypothetical protein